MFAYHSDGWEQRDTKWRQQRTTATATTNLNGKIESINKFWIASTPTLKWHPNLKSRKCTLDLFLPFSAQRACFWFAVRVRYAKNRNDFGRWWAEVGGKCVKSIKTSIRGTSQASQRFVVSLKYIESGAACKIDRRRRQQRCCSEAATHIKLSPHFCLSISFSAISFYI